MKKILAYCCLFIAVTSTQAQVFPKDTLVKGPGSNRVNLVYLSDGYTASELPTFKTDVTSINTKLFQTSPFKEYSSYFNVYLVNVPSVGSGTKHANNAPDCPTNPVQPVENPMNYFGSRFDFGGIHRLVVADSSAKAFSVLASNFPAYHQAVLVANSTYYGGSGGWLATLTRNSNAAEVAIHEIGHSFASLADEYWAGAQYAAEKANMTREANPSLVKWKNWVGTENIGVHSYAVDPTWYRPVTGAKCKMEVLGVPFCAVCRETIVERIHQLVKPIDSYWPASTSLTTNNSDQGFKLNLVKPNPNTLKVVWKLNGIIVGSNTDSINLSAAQIRTGAHVVTATVTDTIVFTRAANHLSAHTCVVQWNLNSVTRVISPELYSVQLKVYPNPFSEQVYVSYELNKRADIKIELLNMQGQLIKRIEKRKQEPGKYQVPLANSSFPFSDGVYFIRFSLNGNSLTEETIRIKR